jgi:protein-S-isoprenylcysteine O-methyltransferase Ste14
MSALTLKIIFMIGFVLMYGIRAIYAKDKKKNIIAMSRVDSVEKMLLVLVTLGMWVAPLLYVFTSTLDFAEYELPLWVSVAGVAVYTIGVILFWKSHHDLGRNWSATLEVRASHELITKGIYKRIRHPMYSAIWLIVIAQSMLLPNAVAGLSGVVCFGTLYFMRVGNEEKMMMEQFGTEYQTYMQKTGRLFPKLL